MPVWPPFCDGVAGGVPHQAQGVRGLLDGPWEFPEVSGASGTRPPTLGNQGGQAGALRAGAPGFSVRVTGPVWAGPCSVSRPCSQALLPTQPSPKATRPTPAAQPAGPLDSACPTPHPRLHVGPPTRGLRLETWATPGHALAPRSLAGCPWGVPALPCGQLRISHGILPSAPPLQ